MRAWYTVLSLIRRALRVCEQEDIMLKVYYIIWKESEWWCQIDTSREIY